MIRFTCRGMRTLAVVAVLSIAADVQATNLIINGDFSNGNTGFTSQYSYNTNVFNFNGPELAEGSYAVVTRASDVHFAWGSYFDHTSGNSSGKYFVANASSDTSKTVWQSGAISVSQPNTAYRFEAWMMKIYGPDPNPSVLSFQIGDGANWTNMGQTASLGSGGQWVFTYADGQFGSAGTYYVRLKNSNGAPGGNDLGLDDIYFGLRSNAPSVGSTPGTTPTSFNPTPVPEPSTYAMALVGMACGGFTMWRRRKRTEVRAAVSLVSATRDNIMNEISARTPRMKSLLSALCRGFVLLFGSFGITADAEAATIAFWSGNGNANSSVGGHDGTLVNGAGFAAGQFGQQAFSLNSGSSQYISVPDSPAWDFGSNPFSIAMWVNFASISGGGLGSGANALMGHDEGGGTTNKWFFSYMSDGTLGLHINSTGGSGVFLTSPSASPVATGTWNLFAITRSGSTYTFYENATSLGTANYSTALPAIAAPLTIGHTGEGIGFVNGLLQNVQIFDTALSASEVAALVPEPSALAGCAVALGSLGMYRLRRRRRHAVRAAASLASQPMETTS